MTTSTKNFLTSKTLIGVVTAVASLLAAKHGIVLDADGFAGDVLGLLGAALAIYGRFKATTNLTVLPQ